MNITCPHCNTRLNLPDGRIPKDRDTSFKCPKCKGAVPVKAAIPQNTASFSKTGSLASSERSGEENAALYPPLPSIGENMSAGFSSRASRHRALICMGPSSIRDLLTQSIRRLDFSAEFPKTMAAALDYIEHHFYLLVVLDHEFKNADKIAGYFKQMDMLLRRRICLVHVAEGVETGNAMAALHSSANFILNRRDLLKEDDLYIEDMLNQALTHHRKMYAVFNEAMKAVGKA
ncbi:MAG: hypothetical protein CSA29_05245 [Desulfobacterales bacterium]|nr:MAG: hypothetical protein CSA29_05245 [Desulfobacterales bacterium]